MGTQTEKSKQLTSGNLQSSTLSRLQRLQPLQRMRSNAWFPVGCGVVSGLEVYGWVLVGGGYLKKAVSLLLLLLLLVLLLLFAVVVVVVAVVVVVHVDDEITKIMDHLIH